MLAKCHLLFITPEAAVQNVTTDAIFQLQYSNQLGKIFINEAHLFATEETSGLYSGNYQSWVQDLKHMLVLYKVHFLVGLKSKII